MDDQTVIEGLVSIQAVVDSDSREIAAIYVQRGRRHRSRAVPRLLRSAQSCGIPVDYVGQETIETLANGQTHGGIIALVGPRRYVRLEDILHNADCPFVAMLDGIEDPFNFGAAIRALYAAGANGLVVRPRNWMSAAGVVARSSAGASELMPTAVAQTTLEAADICRAYGLTVACATEREASPIYDLDLAIPLFVVVGGEKRGITRSFVEQADVRLRIPYQRDFGRSLGAASAIAVLAFEIMRQKRKRSKSQGSGGQ
jgi:23S rRNA (guanosine2251-2'-O)-methyltransferase